MVTERALPVLTQLPSHTPLLTRSTQYSYLTALVDAAHESRRAVLERPVALLLGDDLAKAPGGALMVIDSALVTDREAASVTRTVNDEVPAVVGVPLISPVFAFSVRPAFSVPEAIDQT